MRIFQRIICFLIVILSSVSCQKEDYSHSNTFTKVQMLESIYTANIEPINTSAKNHASLLHQYILEFATDPAITTLIKIQEQWKRLVNAWKIAELYDLGEIKDSYVHTKIDQWPANIENINSIIASSDSISNEYIEHIGSSSKGLKAIEYLIFDAQQNNMAVLDSLQNSSLATRRVLFLKAISENLVSKLDAINNIWNTSYKQVFINDEQTDISSSTSMLINEIIGLLENMVHKKLADPIGITTGDIPQAQKLEYYYSSYSLEAIKYNMQGITNTFYGYDTLGNNNLGLDDYLMNLHAVYYGEDLTKTIGKQITEVEKSIKKINSSLNTAIEDQTEDTKALYNELKELLILFKTDVANVTSTTVTFSDNDGD